MLMTPILEISLCGGFQQWHCVFYICVCERVCRLVLLYLWKPTIIVGSDSRVGTKMLNFKWLFKG